MQVSVCVGSRAKRLFGQCWWQQFEHHLRSDLKQEQLLRANVVHEQDVLVFVALGDALFGQL